MLNLGVRGVVVRAGSRGNGEAELETVETPAGQRKTRQNEEGLDRERKASSRRDPFRQFHPFST